MEGLVILTDYLREWLIQQKYCIDSWGIRVCKTRWIRSELLTNPSGNALQLFRTIHATIAKYLFMRKFVILLTTYGLTKISARKCSLS